MLKIEKAAILWSIDTEASNFQVSLKFYYNFSEISTLLKLVLEIGTLVLFSSAFNQGDLFQNQNQENEMASSAARNSKKSGLL